MAVNDEKSEQQREGETEYPPPENGGAARLVSFASGLSGAYAFHPRRLVVDVPAGLAVEAKEKLIRTLEKQLCELIPEQPPVRASIRSGTVVLEIHGQLDKKDSAGLPALGKALAKVSGLTITVDVAYAIAAFTATPMSFSGTMLSNPMSFGSVFGSPMSFGGDLVTDPMSFSRGSTARPNDPLQHPFGKSIEKLGDGVPAIAVIDTGYTKAAAEANGITDPAGEWRIDLDLIEFPDPDGDELLDLAAGHNGFIQGILRRASPDGKFVGYGPISNSGIGFESDIAEALDQLLDVWSEEEQLHGVLNLSFSGYYEDDEPPPIIASRLERLIDNGVVVVASAGNDGGCRPAFPAAMHRVVGVGSVGACGPSTFSNRGSWVNASAPGEDVVSVFFDGWDGGFEPLAGSEVPDPDEFEGWAMWSGTSFSAPRVAGAIARQIQLLDCTALEAKQIVLDRPGLFRLPDYGVIVNQGF